MSNLIEIIIGWNLLMTMIILYYVIAIHEMKHNKRRNDEKMDKGRITRTH